MVFGYNTEVLCGSMRFHVQTEDRGPSNPIIETLVYRQGEIVTSMRHNYSALLGHQELEKEVKALLKKQHNSVVKNVEGGQLNFDVEETPVPRSEEAGVGVGVTAALSGRRGEGNGLLPSQEKTLELFKEHVESMEKEFFSFLISFPSTEYKEEEKSLAIAGKVKAPEGKKPAPSTQVKVSVKDKKNRGLGDLETRTNFYGEYRGMIVLSEESRPYWIDVEVLSREGRLGRGRFLVKQ